MKKDRSTRKLSAPPKLKITFNDGLESPKLENKSLSSRTPKPSPLDDRHREDDVKPKKKGFYPSDC
jgi:hypothetical protein